MLSHHLRASPCYGTHRASQSGDIMHLMYHLILSTLEGLLFKWS